MNIGEFVENYVKEKGLKLSTHQKGMIKAIEDGKMMYYPGRVTGKSVLAEAVNAYLKYKEENK